MRKPVLPYANNKDADQPAHLRSLISVFVIRCLDSIMPLVSISEISNLPIWVSPGRKPRRQVFSWRGSYILTRIQGMFWYIFSSSTSCCSSEISGTSSLNIVIDSRSSALGSPSKNFSWDWRDWLLTLRDLILPYSLIPERDH